MTIRRVELPHDDRAPLDFRAAAAAALAARAHRSWAPGGTVTGREYTARNPARADHRPGSFRVNEETGTWADFATGDGGGDLVSLRAYLDGTTQAEAARAILADLPPATGHRAGPAASKPAAAPHVVASDDVWQQLPAHPSHGPHPDQMWRYRDAEGRTLFAELRWGSGKAKRTAYLHRTETGWRWALPDLAPRPMYGLDLVASRPGDPVIWCEGPKAAAALQAALWQAGRPGVCVTGCGGAGAQHRTDWTPLRGRAVTLWPDRDEPGRSACRAMRAIAGQVGVASVRVVDVPGPDDGQDAADLDAAEALAALDAATAPAADAPAHEEDPHVEAAAGRRIDWPVTRSGNGQPTACIPNVAALLDACGCDVRYDETTKRIAARVAGVADGDCHDLAAMATIRSYASAYGLPLAGLDEYIATVAWDRRVNSVRDWITSRTWDGVDRIGQLAETLETPHPREARALLRRWMIMSAAMACRADGGDMTADGILVLQSGDQGVGKTRWISSLAPSQWCRTGILLDPGNKDSLIEVLSLWIVGLDELDASITPAKMSAIKAFVTRPRDEVRLPYTAKPLRMPRRTSFAASVNHTFFLSDPTGNRRFWTLEVSRCDYQHDIDMQQAWAQALSLSLTERTWLTDAERMMVDRLNQHHTAPSAVALAVGRTVEARRQGMTFARVDARQVLLRAGYREPTSVHVREAQEVLRGMYGAPVVDAPGCPMWDVAWRRQAAPGDEGGDDPSPF